MNERELHEAWDALEPPRFEDAGGEPSDPVTRAAVDWMRAAWVHTPAPPVRREPVAPRRVAAGVAAALLAAASIAVLVTRMRGTGPTPVSPAIPEAHGRAQANGPFEEAPLHDPNPPVLAAPIRPLIREDGSIEMRSGKVRLILVNPE
ncbi:MAG: hypothetical protein GY711_12295 [bacterium]|nr:hypothetical protein [bacterium]